MTIPAAVSVTITIVGALFALLTARMSTGPGWRELLPFSIAAACAAVFAATETVFTLPVSSSTLIGASRISLLAAGGYGAMWFVYGAMQEHRPLSRFERIMIGIGLTFGAAALVPQLLVGDVMATRHIGWLHVDYRDAVPTRLGELCYAFYSFATLALVVRYFVKWRRGDRDALAHCIGVAFLLVTGINDSLTASRVYDAPYLLDVGFLAVVSGVGFTLTSRFVESARSLEQQSLELRAAQAELVKRERLAALGELSAVVAHEVRTPVSIMFNALSVLRRGREPKDTESLIAIVEEEARRLKRMIDDLLAFARPHTLTLTSLEIGNVVEDAIEAARAASGMQEVEVVAHIDADLPKIVCDQHLIREAVVNLVTNAMQASRKSEPVRVVIGRVDHHVRIAVIDDGVGIPRELAPRLFTPFFTTRPTGTGLGLAVVRRIAEAHGGEAFLEPTATGATFVLVLPIAGIARPATSERIDAPN